MVNRVNSCLNGENSNELKQAFLSSAIFDIANYIINLDAS